MKSPLLLTVVLLELLYIGAGRCSDVPLTRAELVREYAAISGEMEVAIKSLLNKEGPEKATKARDALVKLHERKLHVCIRLIEAGALRLGQSMTEVFATFEPGRTVETRAHDQLAVIHLVPPIYLLPSNPEHLIVPALELGWSLHIKFDSLGNVTGYYLTNLEKWPIKGK